MLTVDAYVNKMFRMEKGMFVSLKKQQHSRKNLLYAYAVYFRIAGPILKDQLEHKLLIKSQITNENTKIWFQIFEKMSPPAESVKYYLNGGDQFPSIVSEDC